MMLDMLKELLTAAGADAWEITEETTEGWEFYFIRHRLDQNRARLTSHTTVKVYCKSDDGAYLGSAQGEIHPTATRSEAEAVIRELLTAAAYIKNPYYTLHKPASQASATAAEVPAVDTLAADFLQAMAAVPETATEDINSYEIFVDRIHRRFLNSEGIDREVVLPKAMLEVIVNARREEHEIELYRMYHAGSCDRAALIESLTDTMRMGRDKLMADKTPALGTSDVVFSSSAALEIYGWFCAHMDAGVKVRGMSDWEIGQPICAEATGDLITLSSLRELPNSSRNTVFDAEGADLRDQDLIRDNVPVSFAGSRQFACRLGLDDSFVPANFRVTSGTASAEELRSGNYLEAVEFSDFQVDIVTGNIMGEIRLGYLHQDGQVLPVSGGSLTGGMRDFVKTMRCSKELKQYDCMLIPAVTRLYGVTVAAC